MRSAASSGRHPMAVCGKPGSFRTIPGGAAFGNEKYDCRASADLDLCRTFIIERYGTNHYIAASDSRVIFINENMMNASAAATIG
jgi:hypothetical protein